MKESNSNATKVEIVMSESLREMDPVQVSCDIWKSWENVCNNLDSGSSYTPL